MAAILQVLSGLVAHANSVGTQTHLPYDQFIGIAQRGLVLILVDLARLSLFGPQNRKFQPYPCHNLLELKGWIFKLLCGEELPYCAGFRKAQECGHVSKSNQPTQRWKRP